MNWPYLIAAVPPLMMLSVLAYALFYIRKDCIRHKRFLKADADCKQAITLMGRSTNESQFLARQQRVEECLEMMEAIKNER